MVSKHYPTNYYTINNIEKNYNSTDNMPRPSLSLANNLKSFLTESIFNENSLNINQRFAVMDDSFNFSQRNNNYQKDNYNYSNSTYPDLSFNTAKSINNSNSFLDSKVNNNALAFAAEGAPSEAYTTANIVPFFAERNRNISADNSIGLSLNQQSQTPPSSSISPINNASMPPFPRYDIENIAEKVYQILQSKIKIQKARRGMR